MRTKVDGGGGMEEAGVDPRCGEDPLPKRKPLRGKRGKRGKKMNTSEEKRRLAEAMSRWLGKRHLGPKD